MASQKILLHIQDTASAVCPSCLSCPIFFRRGVPHPITEFFHRFGHQSTWLLITAGPQSAFLLPFGPRIVVEFARPPSNFCSHERQKNTFTNAFVLDHRPIDCEGMMTMGGWGGKKMALRNVCYLLRRTWWKAESGFAGICFYQFRKLIFPKCAIAVTWQKSGEIDYLNDN
ncbi:hypothetical protein CDAR_46831 [Caerostris darwini]|uniref:Uncharacterized protein n=1 Tax=Caerostris darwini TaxID=1538125 RepID=A0AAV4T139_9ARAC|nr:hypothetical protein CDAR_46831 [Caerostris darwini]